MKSLRIIAPLLALSLVTAAAHADTLLIGSYATTASNPGYSNSATYYSPSVSTVNNGSTSTYALNAGSTWHPSLGNSTYVSYSANTGPNGSVVAPNGDYVYSSTFTLSALEANIGIGSLTVLADDTVSVYLNGLLLLQAAGPISATNTYATCSDTGPNCRIPTTFSLAGLLAGVNTLTFDVKQVNLFSEGLDYDGSIVATVPEPGTLALASTGLIGLAGFVRRRFSI